MKDERHKKIYDMIPTFECIDGCTDCCGIVPFSGFEWEQLKPDEIKTKSFAEIIENPACPFIEDGKHCGIYEKRPLMCRIYGTIENLKCPHDKKPLKFLTREQERYIMREYKRLTKKKLALPVTQEK